MNSSSNLDKNRNPSSGWGYATRSMTDNNIITWYGNMINNSQLFIPFSHSRMGVCEFIQTSQWLLSQNPRHLNYQIIKTQTH